MATTPLYQPYYRDLRLTFEEAHNRFIYIGGKLYHKPKVPRGKLRACGVNVQFHYNRRDQSFRVAKVVWLMKKEEWPERLYHIDGDTSNADIRNLTRSKAQTKGARSMKIRKGNTSGVRGVHKQGNRWRATIGNRGIIEELGTFDTVAEAAVVRGRREGELGYTEPPDQPPLPELPPPKLKRRKAYKMATPSGYKEITWVATRQRWLVSVSVVCACNAEGQRVMPMWRWVALHPGAGSLEGQPWTRYVKFCHTLDEAIDVLEAYKETEEYEKFFAPEPSPVAG
jgi:hypothetical protein